MRRFVLAMLSLFLLLLVFGCASTRSTRKGKLAAESQLTATTEGSRRTEDRTTTNTTAITGSNEKQNIVIEFTKVEYYPEGQKPNRFAEQFQKADSAFNEDMRKALEMANGEPTRKTSETAEGQSDTSLRHNTDLFPAIEGLKKPPNVKSLTTGRIVINGDKQKTTETSVTTATETEVTETQKTTAEAETKETAQTEEEKYPKTNPFLWVLSGIGLAAVLAAGFYIRYKIVKNRKRKMRLYAEKGMLNKFIDATFVNSENSLDILCSAENASKQIFTQYSADSGAGFSMVDANHITKENKTENDRDNVFLQQSYSKKDGVSPTRHAGVTSNPFQARSDILLKAGTTITVNWNFSIQELVSPGMAVEYIYEIDKDGKPSIEILDGIVQAIYSNIDNNEKNSKSVITVFLHNKNLS